MSAYHVPHHFYADDSQLFDTFKSSEHSQLQCKSNLEACLASTRSWMSANKLKLNDEKTETMVISTVSRQKKFVITDISIGQSSIPFSPLLKNLGVLLDSNRSMDKQINRLVKTCHYYLKNTGSIHKVLTKDATATLVQTLILSRLDYCNSLLFGISSSKLHRPLKIQNKAARVITLTSPRCHMSPILNSLHWLRIRERIDFKILCLTYQSFYNSGPSYLQDTLTHYSPALMTTTVTCCPKL
ncbi:uncharacterized protein [Haliotis asinina]|uniref:uncharacterized protein n=1 Tax=Haliotis asinina TaxID=109174 RepID=UPI003531E952